jgi:hypothetical protein
MFSADGGVEPPLQAADSVGGGLCGSLDFVDAAGGELVMIPPLRASKRRWRSGRDDSENKSKRAR